MKIGNLNGCQSADVQMELRFHGRVLPIAQMGPNFLIVKDPIDHPPTEAEITLTIDGCEDRWSVRLPEGMSAAERQIRISASHHINGSTAGYSTQVAEMRYR